MPLCFFFLNKESFHRTRQYTTTSFFSNCKNSSPLQRQQLCLHDPEMTLYGRECLPGLTLLIDRFFSFHPHNTAEREKKKKIVHGLSASTIVGSLGRGICYGFNWPKRSNMTYKLFIACTLCENVKNVFGCYLR